MAEIARLNKEGHDIINLGIGSPDLPPDESVTDQLLKTTSMSSIHGYQPYRGIDELRTAMSQWYLRTYNVDLDPKHEILPLIGSKEGIMHISLAFLNENSSGFWRPKGLLVRNNVCGSNSNLIERTSLRFEVKYNPKQFA